MCDDESGMVSTNFKVVAYVGDLDIFADPPEPLSQAEGFVEWYTEPTVENSPALMNLYAMLTNLEIQSKFCYPLGRNAPLSERMTVIFGDASCLDADIIASAPEWIFTSTLSP